MSGLEQAFFEYKEQSKIKGIITSYKSKKEIKIAVYLTDKDICLKDEKKHYRLCKKHGVDVSSSSWDINFDITRIISTKKLYNSTFFLFKKKRFFFFSAQEKNFNNGSRV